MSLTRAPVVGRSRELAQLAHALDAAARGVGSFWLLSGEAGIGKSRLLEEVASLAEQRRARVLWGRCWEAGGAPAFWPWIQVLRVMVASLAEADAARIVGSRAAVLAELLPELASGGAVATATSLAGEQARFQVLDAVSGLIADVARRAPPLVLAFDDFHAADPSSVLLLDFLGRAIRDLPVVVVASFREPDATRSPVAPLLAALARTANHLPLGPLRGDDVAALVAASAAAPLDAALEDAIRRATEGNPLYVIEMTRLCEARLAHPELAPVEVGGSRIAIPASLASTLRARIDATPLATRELLEVGALLGREFALGDAASLLDTTLADLVARVPAALADALIREVSPARLRFSHILIRDVCYQGLGSARRSELHARHAESLERALAAGSDQTSWAEAAHHWLAAGVACRARAIAALRRSATAARLTHAYEDAAQALERALQAWDADCVGCDPRERAEILLELARARSLAGDGVAAETSCIAVAEVARRVSDPTLLARAALEQGVVLVYARVDASLVAVLEEALGALPAGDSSLRARLMARLAAAQQPAPDPSQPMALARAAIAMARRAGDAPALLEVLRNGVSALMDFADPSERMALNAEHVALAERTGERVDAWRGTLRLVFDHVEAGDVAAARAATERGARLATAIAHPYYLWHVEALRALHAIRAGRFAEGVAHADEARRLAERARDPNATRSLALQRWWLARLRGDAPLTHQAIDAVERSVATLPVARVLGRLLRALAALEHPTDSHARGRVRGELLSEELLGELLAMDDLSTLSTVAAVATSADDPVLALRVHERLAPHAHRCVSWGLFGMFAEGPVSAPLGRLAAVAGRLDEARESLEDALARSRAQQLRPYVAASALDLACVLERAARDRDRAAALRGEARAIAEELGMDALARRAATGAQDDAGADPRGDAAAVAAIDSSVATAATAAAPAASLVFELRRAGETWEVSRAGRTVHLRDSKGLRMLGALVDEPRRERHVLDLVALADGGAGDGNGVIDRGDAGELLDARARDAYRQRAMELRAELEEAERWNDAARAQRAHGELDALSEELARGVGLGGRDRRAAGAAERARVNVQRRLRDAIRRIEEQDLELGRHLARAIRTGTFCSYDPV
ncbi:MAG: AAA family ATPase [bacterium]